MSKIRKAIAAFIGALLVLPIGEWITGDEPFSSETLISAVVSALVVALGVYFAPRNAT